MSYYRQPYSEAIYLFLGADGLHKIGRSRRPWVRVKAFHKAKLVWHKYVNDAVAWEKLYHVAGQYRRIRGEWFSLTRDDIDYIITLTESCGGDLEYARKTVQADQRGYDCR